MLAIAMPDLSIIRGSASVVKKGKKVSAGAFSSEVETGSRQENASKQESRARSDQWNG
jgi:hypothetical protein